MTQKTKSDITSVVFIVLGMVGIYLGYTLLYPTLPVLAWSLFAVLMLVGLVAIFGNPFAGKSTKSVDLSNLPATDKVPITHGLEQAVRNYQPTKSTLENEI